MKKSKIPVKPERYKRAGKKNFLLRIAVLALSSYVVVSLLQLQIDINSKKQELIIVQEKKKSQKILNGDIEGYLDMEQDNSIEFFERSAREKLGYAYPDEKIFYDIAGN